MAPNFKNPTIISSASSSEINMRYLQLNQSEPIAIPFVRPDRGMNRIFAYDEEPEDKVERMVRENPELSGFAVAEEHKKRSSDDSKKEGTISKTTDAGPTVEAAFDAHLLEISGCFPCPTEPFRILKVAEAVHWGNWIDSIKNKMKAKFVNQYHSQ